MDTKMKSFIQDQGWIPIVRARYHQKYLYASRRVGKKMREVYIAPISDLDQMSQQERSTKVLKKLA